MMDKNLIDRLWTKACEGRGSDRIDSIDAFAHLVAEECAKNAALFSINKQQIHPDIPFEAMSGDAQRVCHSTCQSIAAVIRERFGVKP